MRAMEAFVAKHAAKIRGTLGCFDRILFPGYLPLMSGWAMAEFIRSKLPGRSRHRSARLFSAPQAPTGPAREAPHEAQLDQDVQQRGLRAARRDRHQSARRVSYPQARAP